MVLQLLAVTATLYYMTQPHSGKVQPAPVSPRNRLWPGKQHNLEGMSPAENIWRTFNPVNNDLVHIRVEAPTVVIMHHDIPSGNDTAHERQLRPDYDRVYRSRWSRLWWRMAKPLEWAFKVIAIPTLVTTSLLYGLLLYLLKDAELLEAQRSRKEPDSPISDDPVPAVDASVSFRTLPRVFSTDVELLAASKDGSVIATVGVQNEFVVWRKETQSYVALDVTDVLLGSSSSTISASSTLTAIAVNDRGTYVAVGTAAGVVGLWHIGQNRVQAIPHLSAENLPGVTQIYFAPSSSNPLGMSTPRRASWERNAIQQDANVIYEMAGSVYATYDSGLAIKWTVGPFAVPTYIRPSHSASVVRSMLLHVQPDDKLLVGFALEDGTLELSDLDPTNGLLSRECCIVAGNPADLVSKVHVCSMELEGQKRLIISAATQAGVVSVWDGRTGDCMYILDEPYGPISQLRIVPVPTKRCPNCRELPAESFLLCFSVSQVVLFRRAYLSLPTRKCSCPLNQPKLMSSVQGRKTRSGSSASLGPSSGTSSPIHPRGRIPSFSSSTTFDSSTMYPVSAHGVHSRRASDKRSLDAFIPLEMDEFEARNPVGPQDVSPCGTVTSAFLTTPGQQRSSLWENLIVVRTAEVTFERGGWDVASGQIVGIRKRPRGPAAAGAGAKGAGSRGGPAGIHPRVESKGLTPAMMERWELWTFDPLSQQLQASPLIALDEEIRAAAEKGIHHTTRPLLDSKFESPRQTNGSITGHRGSGPTDPNSPRKRAAAELVPRLHFTRVSPFVCSPARAFCLAGFGNTVGCFDLGLSATSASAAGARQRPSLERLRTAGSGG